MIPVIIKISSFKTNSTKISTIWVTLQLLKSKIVQMIFFINNNVDMKIENVELNVINLLAQN